MSIPLNTKLLSDVVTWAAYDAAIRGDVVLASVEQWKEKMKAKYGTWGSWKQGVWAEESRNGVCSSAYCIAGQTAVQSGYGLVLQDFGDWDGVHKFQATFCAPLKFDGLDENGKAKYVPDHEQEETISDRARTVLGLSNAESDLLFNGDNEIGEILYYALAFAAKRGETLDLEDDVAALARHGETAAQRKLRDYLGTGYLDPDGDYCPCGSGNWVAGPNAIQPLGLLTQTF